jgi:hypothetical protein
MAALNHSQLSKVSCAILNRETLFDFFFTTTNEDLAGGVGGSQKALYALGGPLSAQFTLKLLF